MSKTDNTGQLNKDRRICESMQISNYLKLNHVLVPHHYQGCNFDAIEIDYYNHKKSDKIQRDFYIVKSKFARQQSAQRYQGKYIELLTRVERWIFNNPKVQNHLLPYFFQNIDEKQKKLLATI